MQFIDITGHRYARLYVTGISGRENGRPLWNCRCDCGNTITALSNSLRRGNTRSCGCLKIERVTQMGKENRTHGESSCGAKTGEASREYRAWVAMRERCYSPNNKDFANYGGRGITVCKRWMMSYENFLADMGRCPPNRSIDRIHNDGPYAPDNCRWATSSQQNKNRRPLPRDILGRFK